MLRLSCTWLDDASARLLRLPSSQRVGNLLPAFKQVLVTQPQARLLLLVELRALPHAVKTLNAIGISACSQTGSKPAGSSNWL